MRPLAQRFGDSGLSLLETVLSLFLVTVGVLVSFQLFDSALQIQNETDQSRKVSTTSENILEEISGWSRFSDNFVSDWSTWNGRLLTPTTARGVWFRVRVERETDDVLSPCTGLEGVYGSQAYRLHRSLVLVRLDCGREPDRDEVLWTFQRRYSEPVRSAPSLQLRLKTGSVTISKGESSVFEATIVDSEGLEISDVSFAWQLYPISGNGSLIRLGDRSQGEMTVRHSYYPPIDFVPGQVRLEVRCRYFGLELTDDTLLSLQP